MIFLIMLLSLLERLFFVAPRVPAPPPPSLGLVSDLRIVVNTVLARNVNTSSVRRFLHLLPSSLSAHIVSTTCGKHTICGPLVADKGHMVVFKTVFKLLLGQKAQPAELDQLLRFIPASVYTFVSDEVCNTRRLRYGSVIITGVLAFAVLIAVVTRISRPSVPLSVAQVITPHGKDASSIDVDYCSPRSSSLIRLAEVQLGSFNAMEFETTRVPNSSSLIRQCDASQLSIGPLASLQHPLSGPTHCPPSFSVTSALHPQHLSSGKVVALVRVNTGVNGTVIGRTTPSDVRFVASLSGQNAAVARYFLPAFNYSLHTGLAPAVPTLDLVVIAPSTSPIDTPVIAPASAITVAGAPSSNAVVVVRVNTGANATAVGRTATSDVQFVASLSGQNVAIVKHFLSAFGYSLHTGLAPAVPTLDLIVMAQSTSPIDTPVIGPAAAITVTGVPHSVPQLATSLEQPFEATAHAFIGPAAAITVTGAPHSVPQLATSLEQPFEAPAYAFIEEVSSETEEAVGHPEDAHVPGPHAATGSEHSDAQPSGTNAESSVESKGHGEERSPPLPTRQRRFALIDTAVASALEAARSQPLPRLAPLPQRPRDQPKYHIPRFPDPEPSGSNSPVETPGPRRRNNRRQATGHRNGAGPASSTGEHNMWGNGMLSEREKRKNWDSQLAKQATATATAAASEVKPERTGKQRGQRNRGQRRGPPQPNPPPPTPAQEPVEEEADWANARANAAKAKAKARSRTSAR